MRRSTSSFNSRICGASSELSLLVITDRKEEKILAKKMEGMTIRTYLLQSPNERHRTRGLMHFCSLQRHMAHSCPRPTEEDAVTAKVSLIVKHLKS
jgi:hypothetical protein